MKKPHATLIGYKYFEKLSGSKGSRWHTNEKLIEPSKIEEARSASNGRKVKFVPQFARRSK